MRAQRRRRAAVLGAALSITASVLSQLGDTPASAVSAGLTVAGMAGTTGSDANHLFFPEAVTLDRHGNLLVADTADQRVQEYAFDGTNYATSGLTVTGVSGTSGADNAHLNSPEGVAVDANNNLFVADTANNRVQEYAFQGGTYNPVGVTVAGVSGIAGNDAMHLSAPTGLAIAPGGNLFVADSSNNRVQEFELSGGAYAGSAITVGGSPGGQAGADAMHLNSPFGVALDGNGNLFVVDYGNDRVQEYAWSGSSYASTAVTVAGDPSGQYGTDASHLFLPEAVAIDGGGNLFVADAGNQRIQKFSLGPGGYSTSGQTIAGVSTVQGNDPTHLNAPYGLALDTNADLFVADSGNDRVQEFPRFGATYATAAATVAGTTGVHGSDPNHLAAPYGVALDSHADLFVADTQDHRVLEYAFNGASYSTSPATVAGTSAVSGADSTHLYLPYAVALDGQGNLFVADTDNQRVQEYLFNGTSYASSGVTVAGTGGVSGSDSTHLNTPEALALDSHGNLFIADAGNHRIQEVGLVGASYASSAVTIAGTTGATGTDQSHLNFPSGVALDAASDLFVADTGNQRVQEYALSGGTYAATAATVAGVTGVAGADAGHLYFPRGLVLDAGGTLFIGDYSNDRVQGYVRSGGFYAAAGFTAAGATATPGSDALHLNGPAGIALDANGNVLVADVGNNRVQEFAPSVPPTPGVNEFRSVGSQNSFYALARVGAMYSQTSVVGCTLSSDEQTCLDTTAPLGTDVLDDFSRNEYSNGATLAAAAALAQVCGGAPTGGPRLPHFPRLSRPLAGAECGTALTFGYDSVVGETFPFTNLAAIACTGCTATQVGPVSAGWRTGDPFAGPYTGQPFTDLSNQGPSGPAGSIAERIWCETGSARISDWGQLTDSSPDPANPGHSKGDDGVGASIGAPIYLPAIDPGTDTFAVWAAFVGCANPNVNNADGKILADSDSAQLPIIANADHPADRVAAANQLAESLTYLSYGASVWRPYTAFRGRRTTLNGVPASQDAEVPGSSPTLATARPVSVVYNPARLRASAAGFLNWICDTDVNGVRHGMDVTTGRNYKDELTNTIGTAFFFARLPCATDSFGNSVPPLKASQVTDFNS